MKNLNLQEVEQVSGGKFSVTEFAYYAEAGAVVGAVIGQFILKEHFLYNTLLGALGGLGVGLVNNTASYADKTLGL